ncbi:hypothetical protein [Kitasatospora sp. MBT66]|uniref:hypothetical protein n=1 Tax=Kitasatospora sp. MBT66 TaxID=1444769 RepID=UPI001314116A|nr:hypothetical protein [Kitasatospora sp. MBT66]
MSYTDALNRAQLGDHDASLVGSWAVRRLGQLLPEPTEEVEVADLLGHLSPVIRELEEVLQLAADWLDQPAALGPAVRAARLLGSQVDRTAQALHHRNGTEPIPRAAVARLQSTRTPRPGPARAETTSPVPPSSHPRRAR